MGIPTFEYTYWFKGSGAKPPESFKNDFSGIIFVSNSLYSRWKMILGSTFQAKVNIHRIWCSYEKWGSGGNYNRRAKCSESRSLMWKCTAHALPQRVSISSCTAPLACIQLLFLLVPSFWHQLLKAPARATCAHTVFPKILDRILTTR